MQLKLEHIPKRKLEIEKPDGSQLTFVLKQFKLNAVPALEKKARELDEQLIRGKIDKLQFYNSLLSLIVENFVSGSLDDLDVEHVESIALTLQELRKNKPEAEKKSPA